MAKKAAPARPGSSARPGKASPAKPGSAKQGRAPNFQEALENLGDAWEGVRDQPTENKRGSFTNDNVPDGNYTAQLTANKIGTYNAKWGDREGIQHWTFSFTILDEAYAGEVVRARIDISADEIGETGRTWMSVLKDTLTHLGIDVKKITPVDFPKITLALLDKSKNKNAKPVVNITVANSFYDKDDGTQGKNQRVYVNGPVSKEELETLGITVN